MGLKSGRFLEERLNLILSLAYGSKKLSLPSFDRILRNSVLVEEYGKDALAPWGISEWT